MRRALPALLCLLATAAAATAVPASAQGTTLDRARSGDDAVRALGSRISAVAQDHDTTATTLRDRLRSDSALWVDPDGRLFYVDPAPLKTEPVATTTTTTTDAPDSRAEVLALSSLPGAKRTVHLDVDGVGGTYGGAIGGAWNKRTYTGGDGVAEPYSLDGDMNFDAQEIADIYSIWQRVAEDFAPFDINVTTKTPADDLIDRSGPTDDVYGTRVAITSTKHSCGCGGVAYVGVFDHDGSNGRSHGYYQPAFVYNRGAKYAAEAATHEAGHNLGLSHDGTVAHGDVAASSYYTGHGDWAPIMGVGYYEPISQWSKGEYEWASNSEDDFVIAARNGGPLRADDHATPTALALDGSSTPGVLERQEDADEFAFTLDAETTVSIAVDPARVSPDVDLVATLSSSSTTTPFSDPDSSAHNPDVAGGLDTRLTATLAPGTYTLTVRGTGKGDPLRTGYSAYGSVGAYSVATTIGASLPATKPPTPGVPTVTASGSSLVVSWTDPSTAETSVELQRWKDGVRSGTLLLAADRTAHVDSPGAGTWQYSVRGLNSTGPSDSSALSVAVTVSTTKTRGNK